MNSRSYIPFLILLILQLCLISSCNLFRLEKNYPYAVKGVIDLTGWNFAQDGPVDLKGEWEFYWLQHLGPADFTNAATPGSPDFRQVPDFWNNYEKDGRELPGEGFATFRSTVLLNGKQEKLALRLMEISTAYTLFVNGRPLASAGVPGPDRETTVPKQYRQVLEFEHDTDQLELILHVSNFHHKKGGVWEVIQLGGKKDLRLSQDRRLGFDLFLFGSIVTMGLYHLGLFAVRRINPSPLYFSIFCFLIALRLFTTGERFLIHLDPAISWEAVTKLEYLSFWLVVPAFCLFMHSLFPKFSKKFLYTLGVLGLVFSITALATPARLYTQFNNIYQAITLLTIIYSLYVIFISFTEKRTEAFVFLVGFTVLALMTINDILYVEGIIETGFLVPFGVFAFIFSQASLLSFRFSNALTTVEAQGRELKDTLESYKEEIVQRVQTEDALRASEEKYRTILHSIEDGYYEVDLDGNLIFFNDSLCLILGYSGDELTGMNNRRFMSEKAAGQVRETFNEVYRTGDAAKALDWEMIRKDGSKIFVEASVSLIRDPEGKPTGFRGVARDITDRKNAEEQAKLHQQQLMQASKMVALGTLVSGVAHEINNPNNFIMLNSPILKDAWEKVMPIVERYYKENGDFVLGGMNYSEMRDNIPDLFSGISEGAGRIKQIVDDLKNYVRDDMADLTQEVDINAVLSSAITLVHNMINATTHRFEIEYGKNLPALRGNFQRLEQVVINLIQNACQALPSADRGICVTTFYDDKASKIIIRVQDEGVGIPPETLSQITDPFFTTRQKSGGVGLGLSISSRIVEEHGGSMRFRSKSGAGTEITIVLPVDR